MDINDLFMVRRADIFAIYPRILRELINVDRTLRLKLGKPNKETIHLPSDLDWQLKMYFRLLDEQKRVNAAIDAGLPPAEFTIRKYRKQWDPSFDFENISPLASPGQISFIKNKRCISDDPIGFLNLNDLNLWSIEDIAKAGFLLNKPPTYIAFTDEHEMRRVYSLIYDVFRYKIVLSQALNDVSFFAYFPKLAADTPRVWLLLFDLYLRHFLKGDPEQDAMKVKLFSSAKLTDIDNCLWEYRVRLAASFSRLRIKNSALNLSQLLPLHLQDEKVAIAAANPIVNGWINSFKTKTKKAAVKCLELMGFSETFEDENASDPLHLNEYKWDKICPQFLSCIPSDRALFAQSDFIKENYFIMQDRSFSLGPAIFSRLLELYETDGDVVQTHVSSPRSTAYLASLFLSNNRVGNFIAFGAGNRLNDYKSYMKKLEVNNIIIYAENFSEIPLQSSIFEKVIAIFATPPNSYSGVSDPIDLICSRGGDLSMLEVLTESDISENGKKRVAQVLAEQRDTLRLSMSRPQVQFILYETHSIVNTENEDMISKSVLEMNKRAHVKHYQAIKEKERLEALQAAEKSTMPFPGQVQQTPSSSSPPTSSRKRFRQQSNEEIIKVTKFKTDGVGHSSSDNDSASELDGHSMKSLQRIKKFTSFYNKETIKEEDEEEYIDLSDINVPLTDLFETINLPDICKNQDKCLNPKETGCFIALIKRKEITRMDAKYLIKVAETRGIFGNNNPKKSRSKIFKKPDSKKLLEEKNDKSSLISRRLKRKKSDMELIVNRLTQPTQASINRTSQRRSSADGKLIMYDPMKCSCSRHVRHHEDLNETTKGSYNIVAQLSPRAKQWWRETTKYVNTLHNIASKKKCKDFHGDTPLQQIPFCCAVNDLNSKTKIQNSYINAQIFDLIKEEKIEPLRLSRYQDRLLTLHKDIRPKTTAFREPYPLSVYQIDFRNITLPKNYYDCHFLKDTIQQRTIRPHTMHNKKWFSQEFI